MPVEDELEARAIKIKTEEDIVTARQKARQCARKIGFNRVDETRIVTVASELARNIFQYTYGGVLRIRLVVQHGSTGIAIEALDQGPGIENVGKVLEDGYSTSGGLGAGLPGVKRMMDEFHIQSQPKKGTNIRAIKWHTQHSLFAPPQKD